MLAPWSEAEHVFAEFDTLAQSLLRRGLDGRHGLRQLVWQPNVPELSRSEEGYVLTADLPGLTAEDLDLQVRDGTLDLRAERSALEVDEGETLQHSERRAFRLQRSIRLHDDVDVDGIEATFADGVLTLNLPAKPTAAPRRIAVKS